MSTEKTITQIIEEFQSEVSKDNLTPERAAEILKTMSALLGNINSEIRKRDRAYKLVLLDCYNKEAKANRAKIIAETSDEYEAAKVARDTKELVIEMIRSLKYYLKGFEEEFKAGGNM